MSRQITLTLDEKTWAHIATEAHKWGRTIEEEAAQWLTGEVIAHSADFDAHEDQDEAMEWLNEEVLRRRAAQ